MTDADDADEKTTVKVSRETWKRLNHLKEPGDAFDEVIQRLLEQEQGNGRMRTTAKAVS